MPVTVHEDAIDGVTRLAIVGEMDIAAAPVIRAYVDRALARDVVTAVVLDLAGVTFLDCAAVGDLVRHRLAADRTGRSFAVVNAAGLPREILRLTAVLPILDESGLTTGRPG